MDPEDWDLVIEFGPDGYRSVAINRFTQERRVLEEFESMAEAMGLLMEVLPMEES